MQELDWKDANMVRKTDAAFITIGITIMLFGDVVTERACGKLAWPAAVMLLEVKPTLRGSEMPGVMGAPLSIRNFIHSLIRPALNLLVKGPA